MQILVVAWALLVGAAQEENQSTETYAVECYLSAPLELVEDTVTCLNRTLRVQNGSKAVITGTAECFGDPGCSEDHSESLLLAQRIFTYGGGGLIFSFWACASLAGAWRVPGSLSEPNPQTAKVFSLHGFSRQMLGLNLCFLFLLVSMMSISIPTPAQKTCDFDITWFVLTHLGTRLLLSFLLFILMTAGVTAAKVVSIMRDMPKANLFLPWQEAERFAASVLEGQPCWMDRAVQVPQRPESCWIWCNSKVDASLEMMRRGWRDSKGREYKLEIQIVPMDDFTMHAMKDPGGYFMIEIDGHRLSHGFDQTHYMHFTARKGHCGMDFFCSHFWPMYKSNLTLLGLFQAAREASEPLQVLHVEKSCRLLPAEELKALLCDALMPSPGESGCVPSDHAAVQRVYVWRRRALQAAQRLPSEKMLGGEGHEGDEASTDLLHGNSRREEDLDWAYQGDLQEEANAPYVDRWRTGSVSQQDWFRLIGKAEFWLAHAFLELNRREPGLGHPLQAACEVLTSGLSSGRLTESLPGCRAILGRARKVLEPELRRSILAVERSQLDRLSAACTPVHSSLRSSRRPQSLLTAEMKNCLMAHTSHALKLAVTMKEQQALGYALIEAYRLNGEVLTGPLAKLVTEAWYLFQRLVFERTIVHAGLSPSTLKDIYEQHSCFGTAGLRAAWAENVCSSAFLADVQAFFDVVGQRGHEINVLASDLEVVEIQYVEHALSMQTYLARREELKVCVHPKCSGQVGDAQTVGPLGPWTHSAIRRCQGVWADKQGNYVWLIAGEEVINAATLVAEILEPESAAILRADHGHMNFRALPWPHLLSRPECGDTDSEVSLMWLVHQYSHTSRTNVKQINGVFQDAELGVIFWNSGHRESAPARWERSPVLFGHWWLQGREALLFPLEVFLQGAALLDLMAQHHGRVAEQKANLEAEFVEMAGNGVPSNYGAVLYYNQTFYPIWEERHPLEPIGRFRSRHFTGTVDKSNRRMEISPLEDPGSDALVPPFLKKLFGFRRGITARLSPKPLDLNVNEIFLLQGTTAASAQCPRDDSARVQTQVLSCHAGSSAGSGIYLTDSAVKADQCSELHPNGLCAILICRVCLGRVINQSEGDRHGNSIRRGSEYQSVKLASDVNEYVIFDPSQVYVEYLVWYRRRYHNLSRHE